ncbi:BREX-1 system adenine-specific DNA-methyltransferase PglX [Bifidobacterium pseudolongum]|uniref:site-specific DNA-methyltransferase (adenine-specific) n=1 Tax=Bifidobacterium pseudolongum subsp. globosum TaxID=1690 RepID=A0A2N3R4A7_9BIFI|nr:BREX-1 system adenine-specific DNA-methyltransferase PglX [Bifidobacterium pseudolongum]PKV03452.1 Methyltransferase domain-containing protein [Bifidobacterium pseudolongum subsp. globosum]
MNTNQLQQFATDARTALMSAIEPRVREALDPNSALHADNTAACKHLAHNAPSSDDRHAFDGYVEELTERYAYRWFNRIIAFRYMDVHGYTVTPVVSSADMTNATALPEILAAARRGEYDERVFGPAIRTNEAIKQHVEAIFNSETTTTDPQSAAYGLLMSAACNYWHTYLPFLFDEPNTIEDTLDRVLMPQNLLADGSPLREAIKVMTPETCGVDTTSGNVEIIGWLYQFYIAPRKDSVMAGFKKGKKAGANEIPAATQLFTPEWIVRYLVQNTVGRLWMVNHPDCALADSWEYYIAPTSDDDTAQLTISSPEELTVCDPTCGSGHMLTYAFDLLYEIYEDEGYAPSDIPSLILDHNLFGMEIDERAAQLAAFALTMKARGRSRRFFRKQVQPHIEQIRKIQFSEAETDELNELYDVTLPSEIWNTYANADVFGSLIQPDTMLAAVSDNIVESDAPALYAPDLIERGNRVLEQTRYLSRTYATVVGNPPYMGGKNMSTQLKTYIKDHYKDYSTDLYSCFYRRFIDFCDRNGLIGQIIGNTWMFIKSFESMRQDLIQNRHIDSFVQIRDISNHPDIFGANAAFVIQPKPSSTLSVFLTLSSNSSSAKAEELRQNAKDTMGPQRYEVDQQEFAQIPGSPIVYWLPEAVLNTFNEGKPLSEIAQPRQGLATADNNRFVREWWEVSQNRISLNCDSLQSAAASGAKWFPYNKGGDFRKWYGNQEFVVNWANDGQEIRSFGTESGRKPRSRAQNTNYYFQPSVSWSKISSGAPAFRLFPQGFVFDVAGTSIFVNPDHLAKIAAIMNSSTIYALLTAIAPTLNFEVGQIASLPILQIGKDADENAETLRAISKADWDCDERSWNFKSCMLLDSDLDSPKLSQHLIRIITQLDAQSEAQREREIRNNEIVAEAYGVRDVIDCDVPLERVSLKRNKAFVYPKASPKERDELFTLDLIKELISYAVGCMFGRYSFDKPGLILASQGETIADFHAKVPNPSFEPDMDNVIPMCEGDYFEDDIVVRFRKFITVAFGAEHLEENIAYIEQVLGKSLRKYFLNDFYNDHVKMYSNRPIYWQYASRTDNKGSFKALVYLHRYTPSTTSTVLAYLRDYIARVSGYAAVLDESDTAKDLHEADKLRKIVNECKAYEDDILYPLATCNMPIDLDDGVLVNYLRMGKAVRAIPAIEKKRKDVETWEWPVHPLGAER